MSEISRPTKSFHDSSDRSQITTSRRQTLKSLGIPHRAGDIRPNSRNRELSIVIGLNIAQDVQQVNQLYGIKFRLVGFFRGKYQPVSWLKYYNNKASSRHESAESRSTSDKVASKIHTTGNYNKHRVQL